jgi:predicted Zn-dependent protease
MALNFKTTCILFVLSLGIFTGVSAQEKAGVKYDIDCYEIPASSFDILSDLGSGILESFSDGVTIEDQHSAGAEILSYFRENSTLDNNSGYKRKLTNILNKLVKNIRDPKGFKYEIFYMDTSIINAFTLGGKIFVTKAMMDFCENEDELACIIGHEISHNELGHLERSMKKQQLMDNVFGSGSSLANYVVSFFTDPFGQIDEAYCDMRGMDIAIAAGYKACAFKNLWERMAEEDGESDMLTEFLSTHPNSGSRSRCVNNHIYNNYRYNCPQ